MESEKATQVERSCTRFCSPSSSNNSTHRFERTCCNTPLCNSDPMRGPNRPGVSTPEYTGGKRDDSSRNVKGIGGECFAFILFLYKKLNLIATLQQLC